MLYFDIHILVLPLFVTLSVKGLHDRLPSWQMLKKMFYNVAQLKALNQVVDLVPEFVVT